MLRMTKRNLFMITLYEILGGAVGGVVAITTAIGIPFFKKIIFKVFESKINEQVEKAISDHSAKNETKIHTSKALFELEQQAINHALLILGKLVYIAIETGGAVLADITLNRTININKEYYLKQMRLLLDNLAKYKTESVASSVYLPEEIDEIIQQIYGKYTKLHQVISVCIDNNNIIELNSYFDSFMLKIEEDNKKLKKVIREHYNNIKIV